MLDSLKRKLFLNQYILEIKCPHNMRERSDLTTLLALCHANLPLLKHINGGRVVLLFDNELSHLSLITQ